MFTNLTSTNDQREQVISLNSFDFSGGLAKDAKVRDESLSQLVSSNLSIFDVVAMD